MTRALSERGQRMMGYLPPFYADDPDTQAVILAQSSELDLLEDALDTVILNFFVTQATDEFLWILERHLGLPEAPPDKTLEQRRAAATSFYRMRKKLASGKLWAERLTDLIGPNWTYVEDSPRSVRGRWNQVFQEVPSTDWTYVQGNAGYWLFNPDVGSIGGLQFNNTGTLRVRGTKSQFDAQQAMVSFIAGAPGAAPVLGAVAKDNAYGMAYARVNNGNLNVMTYNGTTHSVRATTAAALTEGTRYWLLARVSGNSVTAELYTDDPTHPGVTPWKTAGPYTLAGADATGLGTGILGYGGIYATAMTPDYLIERMRMEEVGFTLADYTLRVTVPFGPDNPKSHDVLNLLANSTPAELDVQVFFDVGFVLGYSHLGEEGF